MTIECTFAEFKTMTAEFLRSLPDLQEDQAENGLKCLGLAYVGMNEPMWQRSAYIALQIAETEHMKRFTGAQS